MKAWLSGRLLSLHPSALILHPFLLRMYSLMASRSSSVCSSLSAPVTARPSWKPMTVRRPSIWKLKVKVLPLSSSKTRVGDTHATLLDSRGIFAFSVLIKNSRDVATGPRPSRLSARPTGGASLAESGARVVQSDRKVRGRVRAATDVFKDCGEKSCRASNRDGGGGI